MIIILTFIAFTGLVALISWYKTKEENLSTKEGYFLAGRGLTGLVHWKRPTCPPNSWSDRPDKATRPTWVP